MKSRFAVLTLSVLTTVLAGSVQAQDQTTLDASDRGWYSETGTHSTANLNYAVGDGRGPDCGCSVADFRNFFVFDLTGLSSPITRAELRLNLPDATQPGFSSGDGFEDYGLFDVTTDLTTLLNGSGGTAAHTDLGSGVSYGGLTITATDQGTVVSIVLNADALSALNAATGMIAIGGAITSLDGVANDEYAFGFSGQVLSDSQLVVDTGPWANLGSALAGVSGDPLLVGTGTMDPGTANSVDLSNAAPSAMAAVVVSTAEANIPFAGGILKTFPIHSVFMHMTDAGGNIANPFKLPGSTPVGFEFFLQYAIADPAAIQGISLSNALHGRVLAP